MTVSRDDLEQLIAALKDEVEDPAAGIYGPDTMAWTISKEAVLFLGGGRAALLQTAHPFVAHGVDQHSDTKRDPLGRFQRTFNNVFAMVFGDLDSAIKSARRVHNIHSKILGHIAENVGRFPAGSAYKANDADALLWVHSTLIETAVMVYDSCIRQLTYAEKDEYYGQTRRFARLYGISDKVLPKDWEAFEAYNRRMWDSDILVVGKPALEMRHFLLEAPRPALKPFFWWIEVMTSGMMPDRLREEYELPWDESDQRTYQRSLALVRRVYPLLPPRLRHLPAYVEARRRLTGDIQPDKLGRLLERLVLKSIDRGPVKPRKQRPVHG